MKIKYLYFLLAIALISCKKEACPADWKIAESEYFKVCHPADWEVNDGSVYAAELVLFDNSNLDSSGFGGNINFIKEHESFFQDIESLSDFATFSRDQMYNYVQDAKMQSFNKITIGNTDAYKAVFTAHQNNRDFFFVQYYFKHNQYFYVSTFTTRIDDTPENKKIGQDIVESLELK
jgi:hypothetical protein